MRQEIESKKRGCNHSMRIRVSSLAKNMTFFLIAFMMVVNYLCGTFHFPSSIRYISDIIIAILLFILVWKNEKIQSKRCARFLLSIVMMLLLWSVVSFVYNMYSPALYFWGLRNTFRYFVILFIVITYFDLGDCNKFKKLIDVMYAINLIVCIYQYFVLDYWADEVGGIFRLSEKGGNTGVILLICVASVYAFCDYLSNRVGLGKLIYVAATSILIAAIAELKVFFILFVVIIFVGMILNKISIKTILFVAGATVALIGGFYLMGQIAPTSVEVLTYEGILEYAGGTSRGYSEANDLSRFRFMQQLNEIIFDNFDVSSILGLGLGSTDVSGIAMFRSAFFDRYQYLHHTWFSSSMLYLELGLVGLIGFVVIFGVIIINLLRFKHIDKTNMADYAAGILLSIIAIVMVFYNASMRSDVAFFYYVSMAIPYVIFEENVRSMMGGAEDY